ncbi:hypothetical protein PR048_028464 [Dryococelus australis]|uniref:Uncharacterized protein n=1 Tax=Dryococelus australis TaxID=614101 RepID=A0ABQ9GDF2_9NEOP|nr:hypothetical protein PR048_028464 [Dryococelus australis]
MHKLYLEKYDNKVSYSFYRSVYRDNFNNRFDRPQINTYCTCEELNLKIKSPHLNEVAKRTAMAELMVRTRRSRKSYSALQFEQSQETKKEGNVISSFYFMQNIILPKVPVQELFYLHQLTVSVFCITDIKAITSAFNVYHEGKGRKSDDEVCSFLHDYVKQVPEQITELRILSDNCATQNKNHALIRYLLSLTDSGIFEKKSSTSSLSDTIAFCQVTRNSDSQGKFIVKEVKASEILYFKQWWQTYYKKNAISEESKHKPRDERVTFDTSISSLYHFVYTHDMKGYITAYVTINCLVPHTLFMLLGNGLIVHPDRLAYK